MPPNRTDTASARRARREQHLAVRTVSSNAPADSISAPGKLEPPTSPTITIPARPIPQTRFHTQSPSKPQTKPWRHADELPFIRTSGKTWPDMAIARFLRATAISIPPAPVSTSERFIHVRCGDGYDVALPRGYRLPLLWVVKFLWSSVPIVMSEAGEWDDKKFDLLHVARLIDALLSGARRIQEEREKRGKAMDRSYRCAAFDRALRRYWHRWLVMRDEFVRDFWREFEEDEFKEDVLKLGWYTWVLKGHKGFYLTKDEVTNGLTSDDFLREFVVDEQKKTFAWVGAVPESQSVSPAGAEPPAAVAPMPLPQNELFLPPLKKARTDKSASASTSAAVAPRPANPSPTKRARKVPPKTLDRPQSILEQPIRAPWPSSSSSPSPPLNRRPSTSALSVPKQAQLHASISLPVVDVQKQPKAHQSKSKGPVVPTLNGNTKGKSATADANATANANANEAQNANAKAKAGADGSENRNAKAKATVNANARAPVHGSVSLAELVSRIPLGGGRHRLHNLHSNIFDERPSLSVPPPPPLHNANAGVGAQSHSIVMPLVSEPSPVAAASEGEKTPTRVEGGSRDVEMQDVSVEQSTASIDKSDGCSGVLSPGKDVALSENVDDDDSDDDLVLLYPQSSPVQPRSPASRVSPPRPLLRSRSRSPSDSISVSSRSPSPPMLSLSTARFPSETPQARPQSLSFNPDLMPGWGSISQYQSAHAPPPPTSASSFASISTSVSTVTVATTSTAPSELATPRSLVELAADPTILARLADSWQELRTEVSALRAELRSRAESESGDAAATSRLEERVRRLEGGRASTSISQARPPAIPLRASESTSVAAQFQSNAAAARALMHWHPLQHLIAGDGIDDGGAGRDGDAQMIDVPRGVEGSLATATQREVSGLVGPGFSGGEVPLPPRSRKFREGVRLGDV